MIYQSHCYPGKTINETTYNDIYFSSIPADGVHIADESKNWFDDKRKEDNRIYYRQLGWTCLKNIFEVVHDR